MRIFIISLTLILNFIFQTTIFRYIEIFGISPNTTIIIIVSFAILRHELEGGIIGFFAGLLQDIFFSRALGINALLYMLIGYVCGKPFKSFYRENFFLPLFLVGISTFFYNFLYYILNFLFLGKINVISYFSNIILPEIFYNVILTIPLYGLIYLININLEKFEMPNRKLF